MAMFMNPMTGSVATLEEWQRDFEDMSLFLRETYWGGPNFEDAGLVQVEWNCETEQYEEV